MGFVVAACASEQGPDCHLDVRFTANIAGHEQDPCVATLRGTRTLVFDLPTCTGTGCYAGVYLCRNRDPQGPSMTCGRFGDHILFGADPETSDAIFAAIGSTTVALEMECGGVDLPDSGSTDAVEEVCAD